MIFPHRAGAVGEAGVYLLGCEQVFQNMIDFEWVTLDNARCDIGNRNADAFEGVRGFVFGKCTYC